MNQPLQQFQNQQYLNIETFRKNGLGVKTPVWFAQDGETLLVWTGHESGKATRIRRDGKVRIVPSTMAGEPLGEWTDASAVAEDSTETMKHVEALFQKKYGFTFTVYRTVGNIRGGKRTALILKLR